MKRTDKNPLRTTKGPACKVSLDLSSSELEVLLSIIEGILRQAPGTEDADSRGTALADLAERARPHEQSYDVAQLVGPYRQLLAAAPRGVARGLAGLAMGAPEQERWATLRAS